LIKYLALFLVYFIFSSTLYTASYELLPNSLLFIEISNLGPTRITIEEQKITDVFFYPEESAKVVLHNSGGVFIVPLEDKTDVFLTLVGDEGVIQDLKLSFVNKQPDPIQLYLNKGEK